MNALETYDLMQTGGYHASYVAPLTIAGVICEVLWVPLR